MPELIYRIDPSETKRLRLRLSEKGGVHKRILYLSTLKEIAKESDRAPLEILIKAKLAAAGGASKDTLSFTECDLEPAAAALALPLLVKTGRLYLGSCRIERALAGKVLWEAESLSAESCRIESFLFCEGKIPWSECAWRLLAPKMAAVVQEKLILAEASGVKWIESGLQLLEGSAKRRFCEEERAVSWKKKELAPLKVLPTIRLHDKSGSFAGLEMDYAELGSIAFSDPAPHIGGRARLREAERAWERDLLEAGFQRKQVGRSEYYCPSELVSETLSLLLDVGWRVLSFAGAPLKRFTEWGATVKEEGASLVISNKALVALKSGRAIVETDGGALFIDRKEALRLFGPLVAEELCEEGVRIPRHRFGLCFNLPSLLWQSNLQEAAERLFSSRFERCEPAECFRGALLGYQQQGVDWLCLLHSLGFGGLLADEMGLGKTVQLLAFFSRLRTNLPVLIVAPTSLLYNWQAEFQRFLPGCRVHLHQGPLRKASAEELQGFAFVLTSYALLRQDAEMLSSIEWEAAVFDESNAIKNSSTSNAQAARALRAKARFCMSGTPIENRPQELVSQFSVLMPELLEKGDGPEAIQKKVRPFLLRRTKEMVCLELGEKREQTAWVEMNEAQSAVYEKFLEGALRKLKPLIEQDGAGQHRLEILEAILRLRQICCDPRLVGFAVVGAKIEQCCADLEELREEGRKTLLFSQFTSMLDLLEKEAQERGWRVLRIDGSTPVQRRADAVEAFQKAEGPVLFLLSLKAAGVGLNLQAADVVLLFDPWWNEAVEQQAIDRAHRLGRSSTLFIKRYLTPASIEEKMLQLKSSKQKQASEILDFEGNASASDFLSLLTEHHPLRRS